MFFKNMKKEEDTTPITEYREWGTTKKFQSDEPGDILTSTRVFGVEIECITPNEEAFYVVGNHFPEMGIGSDGGGYEFKTPRLSGNLGEAYITELGNLLMKKGFTVKQSCGLHIHIDGGRDFLEKDSTTQDSRKTQNLKNLLSFLIAYESVIQSFLPPSRRFSTYCNPLSWISMQEIQKCQTQFDIEKLWYSYTDKIHIDYLKENIKGGPRPGFNLSSFFADNHIEIRYHSGTVNARKILEWVNLFTTIMDRARGTLPRNIHSIPSLEERTMMFFNALSLPKSSIHYFFARQKMFASKMEVKYDKVEMRKIITADTEIMA